MAEQTRIRISFAAREVELIGSAEEVRRWWADLAEDIEALRERPGEKAASDLTGQRPSESARLGEGQQSRAVGRIAVPESFGEFIHRFPPTVTDIERALIAAYFVQSQSENNSFATAAVNELLQANGIRLANPSNSVRRNVDARRVFPIGQGLFRVAREGTERLLELSGMRQEDS